MFVSAKGPRETTGPAMQHAGLPLFFAMAAFTAVAGCGQGLECHPRSDAGSICTVPCANGASADAGIDAAPPPLSDPICLSPSGDAGPNPEGVLTGVLPSACVAGYCQ
jgi:hypothetical protein